jgi:hypothetical protein
MDGLVVAYDGITFQHAAEMLLDPDPTRNTRKLSKHTYVRSLEDLAYGLAFADRIVLPAGEMPKVGGSSPGENLVDRLGASLVERVPYIGKTKEWAIANGREQLQTTLSAMSGISAGPVSYYADFIKRESQVHFGSDPTVRTAKRSDFRFAETHYTPDAQLQAAIPETFVNQLTPVVRAQVKEVRPSDEAIDEFLRRCLVTHFGNDYSYGESVAARNQNYVRLPHVTRSVVHNVLADEHGQFAELVTPHVLLLALIRAKKRDDVLSALLALRADPPMARIKRYIVDALMELESIGKRNKIDNLLADLRRQSNMIGDRMEAAKMGVMFKSKFVDIAVDAVLNLGAVRRRFALRQLVTPGREADYRSRLSSLFSEIDES